MKEHTLTRPHPKRRSMHLALLVVLAMLVAALANPQAVFADELKGKDGVTFTVESISLIDADGQPIPLDQGNDPASYTNGLAFSERAAFAFTWSINTGDYLIQEGDTYTLPISFPQTQFADFNDSDMFDAQNNKIGTIRKQGGNLVITFSDTAVGHNALQQGSFSTSNVILRQIAIQTSEVRSFTFDGTKHTYLAEPTALNPTVLEPRKWQNSNSSTRITWGVQVGRDIERKLTDPAYAQDRQNPSWVEQNLKYTGVYIEDTIEEEGLASVSISSIQVPIHVPIADDNPTAADRATIDWQGITRRFTQLTPASGESKEDFKARVQQAPLQYGIFQEGSAYTVMINLGDWPNENLTFENTGATAAVDATTNSYWSQARKDLWKERYGATNEIDGALTDIAFYIRADYAQPVVVEIPKTNSANIYMDGADPTVVQGSGSLLPTQQTARPAAGTVKLVKFDEDTKGVIEGATFWLERLQGAGWAGHATINGVDSWTTDENGELEISGLVEGEYRLIEKSAPEGYDTASIKFATDAAMTNEVATFTIDTSDTEGVLLYASNKKVESQLEYGSLSVSKTVAGNAADATKDFNFTVTLKDANGAALAGVALGDDVTTDAEGKISFTLQGGASKTITGIPAESTYEVVEAEANQDGYTTTSDGATGTISANETASASFTNTKNYTPVAVNPPVEKKIEGADASVDLSGTEADEFTFTFRPVSNTAGIAVADMPMPEGSADGQKQITKPGAGEYEFGEFALPLPGTYVYQMAEESGELDYDYDDSTYTVTYVVTAGADGKTLEAATTIEKDGEAAEAVVFTNVKKATPKTSLQVTKVWDDKDDADKLRPASIEVVLLADGQPTGKTLVLSTENGWKGTFVDLNEADTDGKTIAYTVDEPNVPEGYTKSVSGTTITNTHVPKETDDPKGEDPEDPKDEDPKGGDPEDPKDDEPKGEDPEDPKDDEPTDPKPPVTTEPEDPTPQDPTPVDPTHVDPTPGAGEDPAPAKTPLLSITKTTDVKNVQVGYVIPYTITVINTGEGDAAGVEVVDTLPEGLAYVSDDSNGRVDGQNVAWTVDVAAGESVSIVINAQVNEKASGKVVNSASITPDANVPTVPQKDVDEESVEIAKPDTSLNTGDGEDEGKTDGKDDGAKTPEPKGDVKANPPAKQNTPASQSKPAAAPAATTPKTVDVTNTTLWLALLALSGAGLAGAYRLRRKEER